MNAYRELKERVWKSNMELPKHKLVLYSFGNVSGIDRKKGVIGIKPSGVPYDKLKIDDIVIVDIDGNLVEGKLNPSSDTKTHLVLYNKLTDIGGVCHTHSTYAVSWAQSLRSIPILGTTHADYLPDDVPCTKLLDDKMIEGDYEREVGNQIVRTFKKLPYDKIEMVLVANHGPFTWGKSPEKAVYNSVILEELAKIAFLTLQINPETNRIKNSLIDRHFYRKHGKNAYYGQNRI